MNKGNERKSRLKSSVLLLLLAAILLIGTSYAWFTSNQVVTVDSLEVNVEAKNGLQISVDGTNWKSIVQATDITSANSTYAASRNQLPATLEAVSTAGNVDANGLLEMYYGTVTTKDGDYIITATKDEESEGTTGRFIAFDLFFKVEKDTPVHLTNNSKVTSPDGKGIENASRIAFLDEGTAANGATAQIQALKGATNASTYIWEPNYDVHTANGIANASDVYGISTTATGATRINYAGVKDVIVEDDNVLLGKANATENGDLFGNVTISNATVSEFTSNESLFTLRQGVTKIRIYMWIEGQDVDCENNASGADAIFDLQIEADTTQG